MKYTQVKGNLTVATMMTEVKKGDYLYVRWRTRTETKDGDMEAVW